MMFDSGGTDVLRPCKSEIDLFRDRKGVINLDAEIPDRAFDLGMPEQELDRPQIAGAPSGLTRRVLVAAAALPRSACPSSRATVCKATG